MPHDFLGVGTCAAFPCITPRNGRELLNVPADLATNQWETRPPSKAIRISLPPLQYSEKAENEARNGHIQLSVLPRRSLRMSNSTAVCDEMLRLSVSSQPRGIEPGLIFTTMVRNANVRKN